MQAITTLHTVYVGHFVPVVTVVVEIDVEAWKIFTTVLDGNESSM